LKAMVPWKLSGFCDEAGLATADQVRAAHAGGLDQIDLRMTEHGNISELPLEHAHAIRCAFDEAGLTVGMFGSPIGKIDLADPLEIDIAKLKHLATLAEVFDCRGVRVFSYFNEKAKLGDQARAEETIGRLGELKALAGELGISLYLENERHIFADRLPEVVKTLDALWDGKVFKFIFDFDNFNQSGDDCVANWAVLKDRVDAFHLKDSDAECSHVPMGDGCTCAEEILSDAWATGWRGHLAMEPHLAHSEAVMATGPSGTSDQRLKDVSTFDAFVIGCQRGAQMLDRIGARQPIEARESL